MSMPEDAHGTRRATHDTRSRQYISASMLILPAYAKLNLALEVVARRADGMHDIDSIVVRIDWHDLVGVTLLPQRAGVSLVVTGSAAAGVPTDEGNLAVRAGAALLETRSVATGAAVWLEKRVPHAAGLGGGSADAAAVMRALAVLLAGDDQPIPETQLLAVARDVGSDVPALVAGGAQRVGGRGDVVQPVDVPPLHVAVAMTSPSVTGDVYAGLLPEERTGDGRVSRLAATLLGGTPDTTLFGSALEASASRANPGLGRSLERARAVTPGHSWHLTGSGGAVVAIASDGAGASSLATAMSDAGFAARACRTIAVRGIA